MRRRARIAAGPGCAQIGVSEHAPPGGEAFARAVAKRPWASKALRDNGFEHYYRRIWFDTHVHDERSLQLLVDHGDQDATAELRPLPPLPTNWKTISDSMPL